jgi:hypothetical protein
MVGVVLEKFLNIVMKKKRFTSNRIKYIMKNNNNNATIL